jgi:hypothetical protein
MQNISEYIFVDFLLYNKDIKINRPKIEMVVAEYAITIAALIFHIIIR